MELWFDNFINSSTSDFTIVWLREFLGCI